MKRIVLSVVCLACSFSANAGWSEWATVTMLHTNQSPARVYVYGMSITDAGCTAESTPTIMLEGPQATDNAKALYATITAAFLAGREVRVNSSVCWTGYSVPIVGALEVR